MFTFPQFGFRSGSSTIDSVFVVRAILQYHKSVLRKTSHAVFVDIKKAFPSVKREALFARLRIL